MTTLPQADLPKDSGILRTAACHNAVHVGVYAEVNREGSSGEETLSPSPEATCAVNTQHKTHIRHHRAPF